MNKIMVSGTIIIIILMIGIPTYINVKRDHDKKMIKTIELKITKAAKDCYLENQCSGQITLGDLYNKNYLDKQVNPVTKKYYDDSSKINYIDKKIVLDLN